MDLQIETLVVKGNRKEEDFKVLVGFFFLKFSEKSLFENFEYMNLGKSKFWKFGRKIHALEWTESFDLVEFSSDNLWTWFS